MTAELGSKQAIATTRTVFCPITPYINNRGYFVTPKFESQNIEDNWQRVYIKHSPLKPDDSIIIKYRARESLTFPLSSYNDTSTTKHADWSSTTVFTTTVDLSDVAVGDEIEIIGGVGSGHIAFVSAISVSTGTYTVTLDEAFPFAVSGDEFYFNVDNWVALGTINSSSATNLAGFAEFPISDASTFLQLKVEMRGNGVKFKELQVSNQASKYTSLYNQ